MSSDELDTAASAVSDEITTTTNVNTSVDAITNVLNANRAIVEHIKVKNRSVLNDTWIQGELIARKNARISQKLTVVGDVKIHGTLDADISNSLTRHTTDDIEEGMINAYFSEDKARKSISTNDT